MATDTFVEFDRITKRFAGVLALNEVSLSLREGECHGLMGENGAGKSTLGKVLAGIHRADSGRILINGVEQRFTRPSDALQAGVGMVHQELAFCPDLSVAENLCMGVYPRRMGFLLNSAEMQRRARELLARVGSDIDPRLMMRSLTTAQEQVVQIASAVGTGARILVFDEPTSSLSEPEAQSLFKLIEDLKARGATIVYVSHRMPEVLRLCDRISVLRDGQYVGTLERKDTTQDKVVQMMVGRSVAEYFPEHLSTKHGDTLLEVEHLSSPGKFTDVSFSVCAGEVVGFAGLVGSGRSEVANAIFGLDSRAMGTVRVEGKELPLHDIREAKRRHVGLLPEDRKRQGLVLQMSCLHNFSMAMLDRLGSLGFLQQHRERELADKIFGQLRVKTASLDALVGTLSGGNQQKVALAKWLGRNCRVLLVDEPTRGVDVGAKAAIHALIDDLAKSGAAVVMISSELPEVLNLSTRILVMREGHLVAEVPRQKASQEYVLRLMAGVGSPADVQAAALGDTSPGANMAV